MITLRNKSTGETVYQPVQAPSKEHAQVYAAQLYNGGPLEITDIEKVKSPVSIPLEAPCPN